MPGRFLWPLCCDFGDFPAVEQDSGNIVLGVAETFFRCEGFFLSQSKEELMRSATLLAATVLMVASTAYGYAQTKGTTTSPGSSRGASEYSPGDQMRDRGGPTQ